MYDCKLDVSTPKQEVLATMYPSLDKTAMILPVLHRKNKPSKESNYTKLVHVAFHLAETKKIKCSIFHRQMTDCVTIDDSESCSISHLYRMVDPSSETS